LPPDPGFYQKESEPPGTRPAVFFWGAQLGAHDARFDWLTPLRFNAKSAPTPSSDSQKTKKPHRAYS